MKICLLTAQPTALINGETRRLPIEPLPEDVLVIPNYETAALGIRVARCGEAELAVSNNNSVVVTLPPNCEIATAYKLVPFKQPKRNATLVNDNRKTA